MRNVLITRDGLEHRYVANRLDREIGLDAVVVDEGRPQTRLQRMQQLRRRYTAPQICGRLVVACLKHVWGDAESYETAVRGVLGSDADQLNRPELETRVRGINTTEGIECIRRLQPDRILVYGSGIIGAEVLDLSAQPPLNLHTGFSPFYRGASGAFWPLHEGELDKIGATIHEVTAKVDGGDIYSVRQAVLQADDDLHAVFARCVLVGAGQFVEVLRRLEEGDWPVEAQDLELGREFRAAMRGLFAELRVRRAIRKGLIRRWCALRADAEPREGQARTVNT